MTTDAIDQLVHQLCISLGCYPAPLHYGNFPRSCCTSVNNIARHGIPDTRPLKSNDILKLDASVYYTVCRPGVEFSAIGRACEEYLKESNGLTLVRSACGHGIGTQLHEPPQILHYYDEKETQMKWIMQEGMVLAIEPVLSEGNGRVRMCDDDIQVCTVDNSRCAQFEHTIAITADGHEILTEGKMDMKPNVLERKNVFL